LLQPVHREVVEALAANAARSASADPATTDPSFTKFVQDLAKSDSDRSFYIQRNISNCWSPLFKMQQLKRKILLVKELTLKPVIRRKKVQINPLREMDRAMSRVFLLLLRLIWNMSILL
jgi:hypothetical protein